MITRADRRRPRVRRTVFAAAAAAALALPGPAPAAGLTVDILAAEGDGVPVAIGGWYPFDGGGGFLVSEEPIVHLEIALYDSTVAIDAGSTPFREARARFSNLWPDGPENGSGDLGCEIAPNILGDCNSSPFGKPGYRSLRLWGGSMEAGRTYRIAVPGAEERRFWVRPLRPDTFTMSTGVLSSSEPTLIAPAYGPAEVTRTVPGDGTVRFAYTGLSPTQGTGLKDDYPVREYGQRPGSHGNGDFGWFPGFALALRNLGPDPVFVALFVNTGFTGPSGTPPNTWMNDTFWKSTEFSIQAGDSVVGWLDFDDVEGWSLSDNPYPHTAGGRSVPDGTTGAAVNVLDRLQVSAIGWEVRSGSGDPAAATLALSPAAHAPYAPPAEVGVPDEDALPSEPAALLGAAPNPFLQASRIAFTFDADGPLPVSLLFLDARGRLVRRLAAGVLPPGRHAVTWDGRSGTGESVAAGIYFVRLEVDGALRAVTRVVRIR